MKSVYGLLLMTFALCGSAAEHNFAAPSGEGKAVALFDCKTGEVIARRDAVSQKDWSTLAAYGYCELGQYTNGTYYCRQGTCTGRCVLGNYPVRCSCQ